MTLQNHPYLAGKMSLPLLKRVEKFRNTLPEELHEHFMDIVISAFDGGRDYEIDSLELESPEF